MNQDTNEKEVSMTNQSSLSFKRTSTGKVSWEAKAYGDTTEEIEEKLRELIDIAKTKERMMQV